MPLISIIIPLYNKERFIENTLNSVLRQTFMDYEVIIIDDGSNDDSGSIVSNFDDKRITVYSNSNNGVSHARNFGISKSSSDLIALLDGDDIWEQNHLENLYSLYENFPKCGLYAAAYNKKYFNGRIIKCNFNKVPSNHFGIINDYFSASTKAKAFGFSFTFAMSYGQVASKHTPCSFADNKACKILHPPSLISASSLPKFLAV